MYFYPDQYNDAADRREHYNGIAPEIELILGEQSGSLPLINRLP